MQLNNTKNMPIIINNPGTTEDSGSNSIIAIILVIAILGGAVLFFVYGLPIIKNNQNPSSTNINVTVPSVTPPTTTTQ